MRALTDAFRGRRVVVVGDVMLDRYWHGATSRISPEAPVPVVRIERPEDRPGGAGNVAVNLAALGTAPLLCARAGLDEAAEALREALARAGVEAAFLRPPGATTTVKLRVMSQHQQLIRLDFEDPATPAEGLLPDFRAALAGAAAVVLSDYAKGVLARPGPFIGAALEAGLPVVVDPKGTDFGRYRGATVVTPNLREFEAEVGRVADETALVAAARALAVRHDYQAVLVTRGEQGMSLVPREGTALRLPAEARDVYDVTGAGDTVCAVLAAALAGGLSLATATRMANVAAGIVVGRLGTASVSATELDAALAAGGRPSGRVVAEDLLLDLVTRSRARGERIVMTNGCFDLLHVGHLAYLQRARELGDRLIVAVNDDASVTRLKGPSRPVTPLAARMEMLAGLACVDWVTPFGEDTPARLIGRVGPDVLVKGGDYRADEVAGGEAVRARGGEVVILDFVPGQSTSGIIGRVRGEAGA